MGAEGPRRGLWAAKDLVPIFLMSFMGSRARAQSSRKELAVCTAGLRARGSKSTRLGSSPGPWRFPQHPGSCLTHHGTAPTPHWFGIFWKCWAPWHFASAGWWTYPLLPRHRITVEIEALGKVSVAAPADAGRPGGYCGLALGGITLTNLGAPGWCKELSSNRLTNKTKSQCWLVPEAEDD